MRRTRILAIGLVLVFLTAQLVLFGPVATGATFSTNVRVNDVTTYHQVNASVAVGSDGSIHVVWEDYRAGHHDSDIYYAKSTDGGNTFGSSVRVTDNLGVGSKQKFPSVAISENFWIHVVWTDMRDIGLLLDDRIYYSRSENGGLTFSTNEVISEGTWDWDEYIEFVGPQLVYDGSAGCALHVVWSSFDVAIAKNPDYGVWYDKSTDCGDNWGTDSKLASCARDASVSAASNGAIGVTYIGMNMVYTDPVAVFYTMNDGSGWSTPAQVDDIPISKWFMDPSVAIESELLGQPPIYGYRIHVAWADGRHVDLEDPDTLYDWDIYYAFSSDGVSFGPNVRVNDNPEWDETDQREPWISQNATFDPKVAWTDWRNDPDGYRNPAGPPHNVDVYFAESSNQGGSFDANQRVNDDSDPGGVLEQLRPNLATLATDPGELQGTYIVWHDQRDTPTSEFDVYFTGDGIPVLDWCGTPGFENDGVNPDWGDLSTVFEYCILYRSPVGDPPLWDPVPMKYKVKLQIWKGPMLVDEVFMNPDAWGGSVGNYVDGRLYTYSRSLPVPGTDYSYTFLAWDNSGREATPVSGYGPIVNGGGQGSPPELLNSGVTPHRGTVSVTFTYLVTYKDADNDPPSYVEVETDLDVYQMNPVDPTNIDYDTGVDYFAEVLGSVLGLGAHQYRFEASDGTHTVTTAWSPGPLVEAIDWWPMYHHSVYRTGFSSTQNTPDFPTDIKKAYSSETSWSSPAYVDNKVFIGLSGTPGKLISYVSTLGTAGLRWTFTEPHGGTISWHSPATAYGNVYITTLGGRVYALPQDDPNFDKVITQDEILWEYDMSSHPSVPVGKIAKAGSPLVAFDKVFVGCTEDLLVAFDAHTGAEVWYFNTGGQTTDLEMAAAIGDKKLIVTSDHPARVWALPINDPNADGVVTTSEAVWVYNTQIVDEPTGVAVKWGRVFFGVEGDTTFGDPDGGLIYALDEPTGNLLWKYDIKSDIPGGQYLIRTDPAVAEDTSGNKKVFIGTNGVFYCLNAFSPFDYGHVYWKFYQFVGFGGSSPHLFRSSPSAADDRVFFQSVSWDSSAGTDVERLWALPMIEPTPANGFMEESEADWSIDLGDLNAGVSGSSPAIGLSFVFVGVNPTGSNDPHIIRVSQSP